MNMIYDSKWCEECDQNINVCRHSVPPVQRPEVQVFVCNPRCNMRAPTMHMSWCWKKQREERGLPYDR